jgi:hypothetical protein
VILTLGKKVSKQCIPSWLCVPCPVDNLRNCFALTLPKKNKRVTSLGWLEVIYSGQEHILRSSTAVNYQSVEIKHSLLRFDQKSLVYLPHLWMHILVFIMTETYQKNPWAVFLHAVLVCSHVFTTFLQDLCGCHSLLRLPVSRNVHKHWNVLRGLQWKLWTKIIWCHY